MSTSTLKAAVVGLGVGRQHARVYAARQDLELVGVVDVIAEKAEAVGAEHGTRAFTSTEALYGATQVDLVSICTPPRWHWPQAQEALSHGAHVLCEKPMAPSVADCLAMVQAAREHGRTLMIAQKKRFHPTVAFLKAKFSAEFGQPRYAAHRYNLGRVPYDWFWDEQDGGGPLLENAIHAFDLHRYFLGEPKRVFAAGGNLFEPRRAPVPDTAAIVIEFKSGAVSTLGCGMASEWGFAEEEIAVSTPTACAVARGGFDDPRHLRWILRERPGEVHEETFEADTFELEIDHFVQCLCDGTTPLTDGADCANSIRLALAAKESLRRREPVCPEEIS